LQHENDKEFVTLKKNIMKSFPIALQQELLDLLESEKSNDLIKASKMKQGRMIVSLKKKYDFKEKSLGMN
jgi:hypothetical protein